MAFDQPSFSHNSDLTIGQKLWQINWALVLLLLIIGAVGVAMLYSAANGNMEPWAWRQMIRFAAGLLLMFAVAVVDIRFWFRWAYWFYLICLALLGLVEVMGTIGMGAQRWIDLKIIQLQPSELMKVAMVLALARYFHGLSQDEAPRLHQLVVPVAMALVPAALVLRQPDLGTAAMLLMVAGAVLFVAGIRMWKIAAVVAVGLAAIPIGWQFLHEYQRQRVLTFLNPETDPLGAGYHILQSQIALGSGGLFGKGFLRGTQSHLNFLPEKQTDFIFTMLAEEFGLVGGLSLLGLYAMLFAYGFAIALMARNHFGRMLAIGVTANLFLYVFINIAMVMGLIPVVGVPLPLISYGGTAMIAVMFALGLMISAYIHRDVRISRRGLSDD